MRIIMFARPLLSSTTSSTTTIVIVIITILSLFLIKNRLITKYKSSRTKSKKLPQLPPGPVKWPIIGNVFSLLTKKPIFRWLHALMNDMNTEIVCVRFGSVHVIAVTCPKIAIEFLKEQDELFASRPHTMASSIVSRGYLTTTLPPLGDQWKKMRKIVTSEVLSTTRHHWLHAKRMNEADNLIRYVYNVSTSNEIVNIRVATRHYAGNVIRKMFFGKRYFGNGKENGGPGVEEEEHLNALFVTLKYVFAFCISDYYPFLIGLDLDGHEKIIKESFETIHKFHDPLINEKIKDWRNDHDVNREPQDLLDVLITLKDHNGKHLLSAEEIKAQTTELVLAVVDNPSNAVEWAMAEMINQPELFQKAIEELDRVVGKDSLVQESDIPNLNFVKACAREAFRLHPYAPFNLPHVATTNTIVAGYFIPKGSHVLLSRLGLGRNPKIWDEPLQFNPERHLSDDCTDVSLTEPNLRFISFSTGRRGCPATTLGTIVTTMLLARLIHGFSWSLMPNISSIDLVEADDELSLAKPLMLRAKPRLSTYLYPTT